MKRAHKPGPTSTITDISFLLLLFFLILAISTQQTPVPVEAASTNAEILENPEIATIVVSKKGDLFLDGAPIELEMIPTQTEYALLADRNTAYEIIHPIITFLKQHGVETLYCLVEEEP